MPKVNMSKVKDTDGFEPIPDGDYKAVVEQVHERQSKSGDEQWGVEWRIIEGVHVGRKVFDNLTFNDKSMWRVKLVCSRLGLDVSGEIDLTPEMIRGKQCLITVIETEYNGKPTNNIVANGFTPLDQEDKVDDDLPI